MISGKEVDYYSSYKPNLIRIFKNEKNTNIRINFLKNFDFYFEKLEKKGLKEIELILKDDLTNSDLDSQFVELTKKFLKDKFQSDNNNCNYKKLG